jgi:divalent metal cation (Fe/Co/Zn/Cd) transporter
MKIVDFLIGLAVLFMGLLPFLTKIEAIAERTAFINGPGSMAYQLILIVLGVLVIAYALREPRKR